MTQLKKTLKSNLIGSLSGLAIAAALMGSASYVYDQWDGFAAYAEHDGTVHEDGDTGQKGPPEGKGEEGAGGHDEGEGGHEGGAGGPPSGAGGHDGGTTGGGEHIDPDSDGAGPRANTDASKAGQGGPVWASEGIPEETELGRLSVARSPDHVLERSLEEALATFAATPEYADFYNLSYDDMIEALSLNWDTILVIDSPLQNLALFEAYLAGDDPLDAVGVDASTDTLLAVLLGIASDKTLAITTNTVIALTTIFEMPMSEADAEDLAEAAEAIRIAVLAGHG